jgi:hypothetical protein
MIAAASTLNVTGLAQSRILSWRLVPVVSGQAPPLPSIRVGFVPNTLCVIRPKASAPAWYEAAHLKTVLKRTRAGFGAPQPGRGFAILVKPRNLLLRTWPLVIPGDLVHLVHAAVAGSDDLDGLLIFNFQSTSTAPRGTVPSFRYRHSSTRIFRANATMPIFR